MSALRRFSGWRVQPSFAGAGPSEDVFIALDESGLTQWVGDPPEVWQTPRGELHELEITTGRTTRLRARIGPVTYTWSQARSLEHDELIERVRSLGGRVVRPRRGVSAMALSVAIVLIAASVAAIAVRLSGQPVDVARVAGSANLNLSDLPAGWIVAPSAVLADLNGPPGSVVTSSTAPPTLTGVSKTIWSTVTSNYEKCLGISAAHDRLYGTPGVAGVLAAYQVTGQIFSSDAFGGSEIGSVSQYYASAQSVRDDVDQYSNPRFGRCYAASQAQQLLAFVNQSATAASTPVTAVNYAPAELLPGAWRRGGVATVSLSSGLGVFHLVSVLVAAGHEEVAISALVQRWPSAEPVVAAAITSILARIGHGTHVVVA